MGCFLLKTSSFSILTINKTIHLIDNESSAFSRNDPFSIPVIKCRFHSHIKILAVESIAQGKIKRHSNCFIGRLDKIKQPNSLLGHLKMIVHVSLVFRYLFQNDTGGPSQLILLQEIQHPASRFIVLRHNIIKSATCSGDNLIILSGYFSQIPKPADHARDVGLHDMIEHVIELALLHFLRGLLLDGVLNGLCLLLEPVSVPSFFFVLSS